MSEHGRSPEEVQIARLADQGMVLLRADPKEPALAPALKAALGAALPARRRIAAGSKGRLLAWMSPDEWLAFCTRSEAPALAGRLAKHLKGAHHLVHDVSDARAVFSLRGRLWREVLARLSPADLSPAALGRGEMRRSRVGQAAAAFWASAPDEARLICFRSAADYMEELLNNAARDAAAQDLRLFGA